MISQGLHDRIKLIIRDHRDSIELIQLALTSAIATLIYSEYIKTFRQVLKPTHKIFVAEIIQVRSLLAPGQRYASVLSDTLIDMIVDHSLFKEYLPLQDFYLFNSPEIEVLKTVFELYMIPNIARSIPAIIEQKFSLHDPNNQLFRESGDIDLFDRRLPNCDYHAFLVDQAVMQLLLVFPGVEKEVLLVENNYNGIVLPADDHYILTISSDNAISDVLISSRVILDNNVKQMLSFVTSTTFTIIPSSEEDAYHVDTSPYNRIALTKLIPCKWITVSEEDN